MGEDYRQRSSAAAFSNGPPPQRMIAPSTAKAFYLVWSPGGKTPPSVCYSCYEAALEAAESMARQHRSQNFYVVRALSVSAVDGVKTSNLE